MRLITRSPLTIVFALAVLIPLNTGYAHDINECLGAVQRIGARWNEATPESIPEELRAAFQHATINLVCLSHGGEPIGIISIRMHDGKVTAIEPESQSLLVVAGAQQIEEAAAADDPIGASTAMVSGGKITYRSLMQFRRRDMLIELKTFLVALSVASGIGGVLLALIVQRVRRRPQAASSG